MQKKLLGFEKIAKNLIDSSIRTEISIIDKKESKKSNKLIVESPELSRMNSHCSLLDIDQVCKNYESLEKEKKKLEEENKNLNIKLKESDKNKEKFEDF